MPRRDTEPRHLPEGRVRVLVILLTVGALVTIAGTFAPWVRSGTRLRSSYDVIDLVERLGFAEDGALSWALRAWPLVPLLLVVGVVAAWWGHRVAVVVTIVGAAYAAVVGIAVATSPDAGLVGPSWGAAATAVAGCVTAVVGIAVVAVDRGRPDAP